MKSVLDSVHFQKTFLSKLHKLRDVSTNYLLSLLHLQLEHRKKYGKIFKSHFGPQLVVSIADRDLVAQVLRAEGVAPQRGNMESWKEYRDMRGRSTGLISAWVSCNLLIFESEWNKLRWGRQDNHFGFHMCRWAQHNTWCLCYMDQLTSSVHSLHLWIVSFCIHKPILYLPHLASILAVFATASPLSVSIN